MQKNKNNKACSRNLIRIQRRGPAHLGPHPGTSRHLHRDQGTTAVETDYIYHVLAQYLWLIWTLWLLEGFRAQNTRLCQQTSFSTTYVWRTIVAWKTPDRWCTPSKWELRIIIQALFCYVHRLSGSILSMCICIIMPDADYWYTCARGWGWLPPQKIPYNFKGLNGCKNYFSFRLKKSTHESYFLQATRSFLLDSALSTNSKASCGSHIESSSDPGNRFGDCDVPSASAEHVAPWTARHNR